MILCKQSQPLASILLNEQVVIQPQMKEFNCSVCSPIAKINI